MDGHLWSFPPKAVLGPSFTAGMWNRSARLKSPSPPLPLGSGGEGIFLSRSAASTRPVPKHGPNTACAEKGRGRPCPLVAG